MNTLEQALQDIGALTEDRKALIARQPCNLILPNGLTASEIETLILMLEDSETLAYNNKDCRLKSMMFE